jgi:hypothetical protein
MNSKEIAEFLSDRLNEDEVLELVKIAFFMIEDKKLMPIVEKWVSESDYEISISNRHQLNLFTDNN